MMVKGEKSMSLKDLRHILWGPVRVYEDATEKNDVVAYKDLFVGEWKDLPEDLLGRQIFLVSGDDGRPGGLEIQVMRGA